MKNSFRRLMEQENSEELSGFALCVYLLVAGIVLWLLGGKR
jgi:hypothetical protein